MTRKISWEALVREEEPELDKPQVAYEFSNGRKFMNPKPGSGFEFREDNGFNFFDDPGFKWY